MTYEEFEILYDLCLAWVGVLTPGVLSWMFVE